MAQQQGRVVRWEAERGFGFILSASTQEKVFFHIRDFRGAPEPLLHMQVAYEEIHVGGKGRRAVAVRPLASLGSSVAVPSASAHPQRKENQARSERPARKSARSRAPAAGAALIGLLTLCWLVVIGWALWIERLPLWGAGALLALNLLTLWMYAADKNAARAGAWRVSENQLHLLALLGGWPAAWWAQQSLRHKTSKVSFRAVYWLSVVLHCAALIGWLWRGPKMVLF